MLQIPYHEIVEAAALLALEGPQYPLSAEGISAQRVHDALRLSRFQLRLWLSAAESPPLGRRLQPQERRELAEEILICEPRARVLGAVLARTDDSGAGSGLFAISRQLLRDHGLAKRTVLKELLADSLPIGTLVQINKLRMRMERWTDLLLGVAGNGIDGVRFGFDEQRVAEHRHGGQRDVPQLSRLILCGLQKAVPRRHVRDGVRARAHHSLHACICSLIAEAGQPGQRRAQTRLQQRIYADHLLTDRRIRPTGA